MLHSMCIHFDLKTIRWKKSMQFILCMPLFLGGLKWEQEPFNIVADWNQLKKKIQNKNSDTEKRGTQHLDGMQFRVLRFSFRDYVTWQYSIWVFSFAWKCKWNRICFRPLNEIWLQCHMHRNVRELKWRELRENVIEILLVNFFFEAVYRINSFEYFRNDEI